MEWLIKYKYGNYNGFEITPQTELVSYTYVISIIVMSFRHSTRYYFKEAERGKALMAKLLCILCNLTCGWWGIPWGPVWTVKETACNIGDPRTICWGTIADRFNGFEKMQSDGNSEDKPFGKNTKLKDILIYVIIGIIIGGVLIYMDATGNL